MHSLLTTARKAFHDSLIASGTLMIDRFGVASNADGTQVTSRTIALHIARALGAMDAEKKAKGQTAGKAFEGAVEEFLQATFPRFTSLRPGQWEILNLGGQRRVYQLAQYEPYRHLDELAHIIEQSPTLISVLGNSYEISPDILVVRHPESDDEINRDEFLVDGQSGNHAPIRLANQEHGVVHAVISCKWTLRSDRAQNARSEALNVIRNRKGRTPHIAVVTGEPTPSRLASLALGTGDMDTVYHFALPELLAAVDDMASDDTAALLNNLVEGKRLRDISDLVLDLTV